MIVLYRIDDRLLHGQILEGWLPATESDCVVIVNDELAQDLERQNIVTLGLAQDFEVLFLKVQESLDRIKTLADDAKRRALVILAGPQDLLKLLGFGLNKPAEVNVGGLHYGLSRLSLGRFMTLSDEDKKALVELMSLGVRLDFRSTPWDEPLDMASQLRL